MEILSLKKNYLGKIVKHLGKVNNELSLFNKLKEQRGGSSLAGIKFINHNRLPVELIRKIITLKEEINNKDIELVKKASEITNKEQQIIDLNQQLDTFTNSGNLTSSLKDELSTLNSKVAQLLNEKSALESEKNALTTQLANVTQEKEKLDEKQRQLDATTTESSQAVSKLQTTITELQDESIESLKTRSVDLFDFWVNIINDVEQKYDELVKEINTINSSFSESSISKIQLPNKQVITTEIDKIKTDATYSNTFTSAKTAIERILTNLQTQYNAVQEKYDTLEATKETALQNLLSK